MTFEGRIEVPIFNGENTVRGGNNFLNCAILVQQIGSKG